MVDRLGRKLAEDLIPAIKAVICDQSTPAIRAGHTALTWGAKGRMPMKPRNTVEWIREGDVTVEGRALLLGDTALVGLKPEVNCVTARQLAEASPFGRTILISMVDGGQKYMPDAESYEKITWESQSSMMMPGAAEGWVRAVAELLREMRTNNGTF